MFNIFYYRGSYLYPRRWNLPNTRLWRVRSREWAMEDTLHVCTFTAHAFRVVDVKLHCRPRVVSSIPAISSKVITKSLRAINLLLLFASKRFTRFLEEPNRTETICFEIRVEWPGANEWPEWQDDLQIILSLQANPTQLISISSHLFQSSVLLSFS